MLIEKLFFVKNLKKSLLERSKDTPISHLNKKKRKNKKKKKSNQTQNEDDKK